jgi:hypothetical protein
MINVVVIIAVKVYLDSQTELIYLMLRRGIATI